MMKEETQLSTTSLEFCWQIRNIGGENLSTSDDHLVSDKFGNQNYTFFLQLSSKSELRIRTADVVNPVNVECYFLTAGNIGDDRIEPILHKPRLITIGADWKLVARLNRALVSTLSCLTIILRLELTVLDSVEQEVTKNDQATASAALRRMLENSVETDCRIKVLDHEIRAHRCVLAANSKLWNKIFLAQSPTPSAGDSVIEIDDYDYNSVLAAVEFLYTGSMARALNVLNDVKSLAKKYEIDSLTAKCDEVRYEIMNGLVGFNAALLLSQKKFSLKLIDTCAAYLSRFCDEVLTSDVWSLFRKGTPKSAFALMERSLELSNGETPPLLASISKENRLEQIQSLKSDANENIMLEEEAVAAIRELKPEVAKISIAEMLPQTNHILFLNMTTLEGRSYTLELTMKGWRIASLKPDSMEGDFTQV
ncbi:unnamed protein product [Enterobius vermicularis]|uniref:BTB domain-containing protein n=1 Tax=Enterobius vermicularis TaxID=51028 RepID=A0A0N4V3A5_ENTVE|nr:unnamed protein product [Enterobius vermicularis]